MTNSFISPDLIRDKFSKALSNMYQQEVPQYGKLLQIVKEVNSEVLHNEEENPATRYSAEEFNRLDVERHGAIRLGTARELAIMKNLFSVMGMYPVGYYDLSAAGVPVHATAFRPISEHSLMVNPFRVFTSLLRLELIDNHALRNKARTILEKRNIFSERVLALIELAKRQGGLTDEESDEFVSEALKTFRWHSQAHVDLQTYQELLKHHRLIADVVCFKGPHINHLTPRTLNIDRVQQAMPAAGMTPKEQIEGPPPRNVPILLRQTSFRALSEEITFTDSSQGEHTARFGEIEQRGLALTPQGRALYDQLLLASGSQSDNKTEDHSRQVFTAFPDDYELIRKNKLGYFIYRVSPEKNIPEHSLSRHHLDTLIDQGIITVSPVIYEDFLPVSAAGIFHSNLGSDNGEITHGNSDKDAFEHSLEGPVLDEFSLYEAIQEASLQKIFNDAPEVNMTLA